MRIILLLAALGAAVAALAACSPLPIINGLVPSDTYQARHNLAYGSAARQRLDVYMPAGLKADARLPVVVFFYGGNWDSGARGDYKFAGEAFASQGLVTVVADYRVYPEVKFPAFIDDSAAAFAWARNNIAQYGGDPDRMFVAGHSAGAYNAAMLAFNPDYLKRAGVEPGAVKGFVGLAGPYDFLPVRSAELREIFGYPDTSPATQPITFVIPGRKPPPSLLITAGKDSIVEPANSARLAQKLRAAGGVVEEVSFPDLDHARLVGALAAPLRRSFGPVLEDGVRFVKATAAQAK